MREAGETTSASGLCRQQVLTSAIRLSGNGCWDEKFGELLAYRQENGHCNVPKRYKPNPALGTWVLTMRQARKTGKLTTERKQRLEQVGFVWDSLESEWERKFEELLAFKEAQGHCNVPAIYKPYPALGMWVGAMRTNRRTGQLTAEREEQLERVGFVWSRNCPDGSSLSPCPAIASSSPHDACDAAMYPSTTGMEVMNLNALD